MLTPLPQADHRGIQPSACAHKQPRAQKAAESHGISCNLMESHGISVVLSDANPPVSPTAWRSYEQASTAPHAMRPT